MKLRKLLLAGGAAALMTASTAYASVLDRPFFQVLGVVVVWGADGVDGTAPVATDFVLLTTAADSAGADLIGGVAVDGATVVTGTLDPISSTGDNDASATIGNPVSGGADNGVFTDDGDGLLNAADTLTAFGVDANSDVDSGLINTHTSSFYVASNAAFDIYAQTVASNATGDFSTLDESDITFSMDLAVSGDDGLAFGDEAQNPTGGASGFIAYADLGLMTSPVKVFDGGQRTAAARGTLAEQSVRFDNTYTLDTASGGYDLSMGVGTLSADVVYTIYTP